MGVLLVQVIFYLPLRARRERGGWSQQCKGVSDSYVSFDAFNASLFLLICVSFLVDVFLFCVSASAFFVDVFLFSFFEYLRKLSGGCISVYLHIFWTHVQCTWLTTGPSNYESA
jgi:hypothetical protein